MEKFLSKIFSIQALVYLLLVFFKTENRDFNSLMLLGSIAIAEIFSISSKLKP